MPDTGPERSGREAPCGCEARRETGCLLCGRPVIYFRDSTLQECAVCHRKFMSNSRCEAGHFVCDACHAADTARFFVPFLLASGERDPLKLLDAVMDMEPVHMHGPEHHRIVPCVLLTAYRNNGGSIDLRSALDEAVKRGSEVPGGTCGYWGVCGAAAGAGIYLSVLSGSNPLNQEAWPLPQKLAAACLERIAQCGGPRCCKRTSRIAVETAAEFTAEYFGTEMACGPVVCKYFPQNAECLYEDCPYYPG